MTNMDDRKKAFEDKYALDQEVMFRIEARTAKLFGLWLASELGMADDEAKVLAGNMVSANLDEAGFEDLKRAARAVIADKQASIPDATIDARIENFLEEARVQIMDESK